MKKNILFAALSFILLGLVPSGARAEDEVQIGKNLFMTVGYKLWLNTWETVINSYVPTEGAHLNAIVKGPVAASIPNLSVRYKRLLLSGSYLTTGNYNFPFYKDVCKGATCDPLNPNKAEVEFPTQWTAKRTEADVNLGFFLTQNFLLTAGYKNVTQTYTETFNTTTYPSSKTKYNGPTIGLSGSAGIGHGFGLYGNAVGGVMKVTYDPSSSTNDSATYEASEVGIAWRAPIPLSVSLGYKFQYLTTKIKGTAGFEDQPASDVTRGYILGLNYTF